MILKDKETIKINKEELNKIQCLTKALEIDNDNSKCWCDVGSQLIEDQTITIFGEKRNNIDCLVRSLEIDPNNKIAWNIISKLIGDKTVTISGKE